ALAAVQVATLAPLATYLPVRDARWLYPTPPAIAWLRDHAGSARVLIADQVGLLYGLRQAHGYDGLSPRRIAELAGPIGTGRALAAGYRENTIALHGSEPLPPIAVLLAPTRELLGVRFLVLPPGMTAAEPRLRPVYDGADARVVEDPAALPRAFVVPRARCVDDRGALALLRARSLAPAAEVLLADCASPPRPTAPEARTAMAAPEARIMVDEPARVVVSASTGAPAWLVLTDTWFPGWRARLDGADVAVQRADHAFRAVALPPGRHEVEFAFTPRGLRPGVAITLAALAVVGVLLLPRRRAAAAITTALLLLLASTRAEAALPAPPFVLTATPSSVSAGDTVEIGLRPRAATGGPWDGDVVRLFSERAAFRGRAGVRRARGRRWRGCSWPPSPRRRWRGDGTFLGPGHSDMIRAPWLSDSPSWSAA